MNAFPQLLSYEGCWPVNDLMMLYLKNTSRRERIKVSKMEAATNVDKPKVQQVPRLHLLYKCWCPSAE